MRSFIKACAFMTFRPEGTGFEPFVLLPGMTWVISRFRFLAQAENSENVLLSSYEKPVTSLDIA